MISANHAQVVDEGERVVRIRGAAAVEGAAQTNQARGNGDSRAARLTGDTAQRHTAAQVERDAAQIGVGARPGDSGHARLRSVEAKLSLVDHRWRENLIE